MKKIKNINQSKEVVVLNDSLELDDNINNLGINGDKLIEVVPRYISTSSEKVISGYGDAHIVIGRDRNRDRSSGYGAKGHTKANAIDIVVGRLGYVDVKSTDYVERDFEKDAARVYISQKSDPDKYFDLVDGSGSHIGIASISLKSDAIRIISRDGGIKLVTNVDKKNSIGNDILKIQGVDIIAGNMQDSLQYTVAGENVLELTEKLIKHIENLNSIVDSFVMQQNAYNKVLANHYHYSPFFGKPTTFSLQAQQAGVQTVVNLMAKTKKSLITHKMNLANLKYTYCSPSGDKYVLSRYNKIN